MEKILPTDYGTPKGLQLQLQSLNALVHRLFEFVIIVRPLVQSVHYAIRKREILFPLLCP
jgi:hypothetical protein